MPTQQDYFLKQGETIDQYNARIASLRSGYSNPTSGAVNPVTGKTNAQVLAESTAVAQNAAKMAGLSFAPGYSIDTSIGGSSLGSNNNLQSGATPLPPTPPPLTIPEVQPIEKTAQESQAQDLSTRLQELNKQLEGQSAYRTEQETTQGVTDLIKTQRELSSRLKALQNEALAIPLQFQQYGPQSGIAQTFVDQKKTDALLANAIQSLGVSAQLEAANGNIALANDLVDRAVKAKFDPIQEQINTAKANSDLIINSPDYTLAEKNRAQKQKDQQDARQAAIDKQKTVEAGIQSIALKAAENGASVSTLQRISDAKSQIEALQIAAEGGYLVNTPASAQEYNFAVKNGYKGTYSQYQTEDANRKALVAKASSNGLPYQVTTQVDKLSSSFDSAPIVKNFNDVQNKKLGVDAIINSGIKGPADLSLVFDFMKALDPASVVRESEYETAAKSGNIFLGALSRFNGYFKEGGGFLPENVKRDFQSIINSKYNVSLQQYNNLRSETARKINIKTGMNDGDQYLTDYAMSGNGLLSIDQLPPTDVQSGTSSTTGNDVFFGGILNPLLR